MSKPVLLLGTASPEIEVLVEALGADLISLPPMPSTEAGELSKSWSWAKELEQWRERTLTGARYQKIVVAIWQQEQVGQVLVETELPQWTQRCEVPIAWWAVALGCAQSLCSENGAVVVLIEMPSALDSENWTAEVAVAEAAVALTRSLARAEGARGIRFNAVTTPVRMTGNQILVAPPPPLDTFPGRLDREVVGAVRLLLQDDACGLTGTVLHADGGRT
jgi:enoyl-[acyl-carrier-protein] reductase (NADH)